MIAGAEIGVRKLWNAFAFIWDGRYMERRMV